jgi:uncharacterized protein with PQ loop repeat
MYIFGIIGMILVQFSTCCQIYNLYKTKKTEGLSVGFLWMIFVGLANYLAYSISINDTIYIISNCIGMFFLAISIGQYYYYKRRKTRQNTSYNPPGYLEPQPNDPYP